ncbi:hypothetical protein [Afipia sp. DC4300-2b1]|uniref:hypothetical protein n=1 Tax=Afipia sp. DC4300-2b1 TaxID=2804672 RepID=UPI003CEB72C6
MFKMRGGSINGVMWRAIDFVEGDKVDAAALKKLVRTAIEFNRAKKKAPVKKKVSAIKASKDAQGK